RPTSLTS
ncbi:unnamed protein product, partial [Rotaria magnacalcarata]